MGLVDNRVLGVKPIMAHANTHQYARDAEGKWVNAQTEHKKRKREYFCECPNKHRLKLVKPSGLPDKRPFRDFFAHISDRSGVMPTCVSCGESKEHRMAKQALREKYGTYKFPMNKCPKCGLVHFWEPSVNGRVELELSSRNGLWKYDCMVIENGKPVFALEVFHTHKTEEEKVAKTREDGIEIAEFTSAEILAMNENQALKNLLCKCDTCKNCKNIDLFSVQYEKWNEEIKLLSHLESFEIWNSWWAFFSLNTRMHGKTNFERAKLILKERMFCFNRIFGDDFVFERQESVTVKQHGLLFDNIVYVGIILDDTFQHRMNIINEASASNVKQKNIYMAWAGTIVREHYQNRDMDDLLCFKDCKWPILKEMEKDHKLCSYCLKFGHTKNVCYKKTNDQQGWKRRNY